MGVVTSLWCLCNELQYNSRHQAWVGWLVTFGKLSHTMWQGGVLTPLGQDNRIFKSGTLPVLALCISPFGWFWFLSFCWNKTVITNRVLFWVLWISLVNYQIWRDNRNPQSFSEDQKWGWPGTPAPEAVVWGEGGLVKGCALSSWSLAQVWAAGVRDHCYARSPLINSVKACE